MTYLFLDTNILLHFRFFEEIAWGDLVADEFQLVIAPIVLTELDKHKTNTNPKIAKRAKNIVAKLIGGQAAKVPVMLLRKRPDAALFEREQLDPRHQDDVLLASIIRFRTEFPDSKYYLVTDDSYALLRSADYGIAVLQLPEELRVAETPDEKTKLVAKLEAEIALLKDKVPKPNLYFEAKAKFFKAEVKEELKTLEEVKTAAMAKLKIDLPFMEPPVKKVSDNPIFQTLADISAMGEQTRRGYNEKLTAYYDEYAAYLDEVYAFVLERQRSLTVNLILFNDGNTPAEDIDVWLHLPDGFTVLEKETRQPEEPEPPYRPKHDFDFGPPMPVLMPPLRFFDRPATALDPARLSIRKTNSYEIECHCALLKHQMQYALKPIHIRFDQVADMKGFTIDYRLNIANVPYPVEGQLNFSIQLV